MARQNRAREIRQDRGLSVTQVAVATGLTRQTIYSIEGSASYRPSADVMSRLAKALGTTVDELLGTEAVA